MENVTFVSNSHQRPAADNLQKLKSLLTNTRQQIKSQTQQVTIKNLYVSSFTLVCFRSGKLTIAIITIRFTVTNLGCWCSKKSR